MPPALPHFLTIALTTIGIWKYPLILVAAIIEGPILMIACGFLLSLGLLDLAPLFTMLVLGDLLGDLMWYYIGYYFADPFLHKHGHFFSVTPETFARAKELFHHYHVKIMLISKVTLGFGMALATLMAAGATRIPLARYMLLNLVGELVLVSILLSIGFFFGHLYGAIANDFKIFFLSVTVLIVLTAIYGFTRYTRTKVASL